MNYERRVELYEDQCDALQAAATVSENTCRGSSTSMQCIGRQMDATQLQSQRLFENAVPAQSPNDELGTAETTVQPALRSERLSEQKSCGVERIRSETQQHALVNELNEVEMNAIRFKGQFDSAIDQQDALLTELRIMHAELQLSSTKPECRSSCKERRKAKAERNAFLLDINALKGILDRRDKKDRQARQTYQILQ